jgi:hypothetical protein
MAGVKGRSGRKPLSAEEHKLRGTYRPDRHGPPPAGNGELAHSDVYPAVSSDAPMGPCGAAIDVTAELLDGLGDNGRAFVRDAFAEYEWSPIEAQIVKAAASALDRAEEARRAVARDGMLLTRRSGAQYAHPAIRIELSARAQFQSLMRQLGLPARETDA